MGRKTSEIIDYLEEIAPTDLAMDFDNVGLLIGNRNASIKRVLICLEVTSEVVEEAINEKIDLIVSHHPVIFQALRRINEHEPKGRIIYKLIKNDIGVYSAHTNLDVTHGGLNNQLASIIGLRDIENLVTYKREKLYKVVVFVPINAVDAVRSAMSRAGAGYIGNYGDCSFMVEGIGTFTPYEGTNPYIGTEGRLEKVEEYRLETIVPEGMLKRVLESMKSVHPYEEVAYDVYRLDMAGREYGMGNIGELDRPETLEAFINRVKQKLSVGSIRVSGKISKEIKNVAVFCGSFDRGILGAVKSKADVLLTGDVKYHDAVDMREMGICAIDAGHFNTERIITPVLKKLLSDKFPDVETIVSDVERDPFKFY